MPMMMLRVRVTPSRQPRANMVDLLVYGSRQSARVYNPSGSVLGSERERAIRSWMDPPLDPVRLPVSRLNAAVSVEPRISE